MASRPGDNIKPSSYEVFSQVDEQVAKPVLGSHGAASWQNFKQDNKYSNRQSVAPTAPLKKTDKLTGFSSWKEERAHEDQVRKDAGHSSTGSGYTTFKKSNEAEEAAERKRIKQIEARIRPDDVEYFISTKIFRGWKFNYIFTTRPDRGTGYYWDGMDAIKELRGELKVERKEKKTPVPSQRTNESGEKEAKPKKKKRKKNQGPIMVNDPQNPMEQVAEILKKRRQGLSGNGGLPEGWEAALDPSSGKNYYFCRATGDRSWIMPVEKSAPDLKEGLPDGWQCATDQTTGKVYYYDKNGETRWDKPSAS